MIFVPIYYCWGFNIVVLRKRLFAAGFFCEVCHDWEFGGAKSEKANRYTDVSCVIRKPCWKWAQHVGAWETWAPRICLKLSTRVNALTIPGDLEKQSLPGFYRSCWEAQWRLSIMRPKILSLPGTVPTISCSASPMICARLCYQHHHPPRWKRKTSNRTYVWKPGFIGAISTCYAACSDNDRIEFNSELLIWSIFS